jgi:hypothetical protein
LTSAPHLRAGGLGAAVLLLALGSPSAAQTPEAEQQAAAMTRTVLDQLAAFRRGDWTGAYRFASAGIQARFSLEAFREMVTGGYAPIADSARATVLGTTSVDPEHGYVEIRVEGRDGETIDALYELVREQGTWKIDGVLAGPAERGEIADGGPAAAPGRSRRLTAAAAGR